jgi:CRISPR-associated endonuclease/helicase Cas3
MTSEFFAHTPPKGSAHLPGHKLKEHLTEVADFTKVFAKKIQADDLGYYAGLWHDLGKYNPEFQQYLVDCHEASLNKQMPPKRKIPHAIHGAMLAAEFCSDISIVIDGHHRGLKDSVLQHNDNNFERAEKELDRVVASAESEGIDLSPNLDFDELVAHLPDPDDNPYAREVFDRLLFSCLIDADRLDTERFDDLSRFKLRYINKLAIQQLSDVFKSEQKEFIIRQRGKLTDKNKEVFEVRQEVYKYCEQSALTKPGIFRLTVPTGGGKTLSGLAFALGHILANPIENLERRVIIAVPYTSIIEQTIDVYRGIFDRELGHSSVLEHHSGIQHDFKSKESISKEEEEIDEGAIVAQRQARLATQNWDAPLIVTTTVQLFESLFSNRTSKCRKLHNIIGSVIILDEVQTLPIALRESICSMLKELVERYHVSVVLCTATQPVLTGDDGYFRGFDRDSIIDIIPVATSQEHFQKLKRVRYNLSAIKTHTKWSWQELINNLKPHPSALVILNTRKDALTVLETLGCLPDRNLSTEPIENRVKAAIKNSQILHLSTLLCGAHRQLVLDEVRLRLNPANPQDCLLISTQVVEAGVDLDFPVVYRALCPLDRIVQAAGRCNREGNMDEPGQVWIFELDEGTLPPKGSEYAKATEKTRQKLEQYSEDDLHNPEIFTSYGNDLYKLELADKHKIQEYRENHCFETVASKFKLIEDETYPIVISYNDDAKDLLRQIEYRGLFASDYRALQPYTISIRHYEFQKHKKSIAQPIAGVNFYVWIGSYDPILGVPLIGDPSDVYLLKGEDSVF